MTSLCLCCLPRLPQEGNHDDNEDEEMSRIPVCCQGMARTYLIASKMCRNIVKSPIFYTTIVGTISFGTGVWFVLVVCGVCGWWQAKHLSCVLFISRIFHQLTFVCVQPRQCQ